VVDLLPVVCILKNFKDCIVCNRLAEQAGEGSLRASVSCSRAVKGACSWSCTRFCGIAVFSCFLFFVSGFEKSPSDHLWT
jgi:hypothetical protein